MSEQASDAGDRFGALVGWSHENLGDRVIIKMQSTRKADQTEKDPVDEFRYFMTKNQAAVLANYLYTISGRLPPAKRRRWFW